MNLLIRVVDCWFQINLLNSNKFVESKILKWLKNLVLARRPITSVLVVLHFLCHFSHICMLFVPSDEPAGTDVHLLPYPYSISETGDVSSLEYPWDCFPDTSASVIGAKSGILPMKLTTWNTKNRILNFISKSMILILTKRENKIFLIIIIKVLFLWTVTHSLWNQQLLCDSYLTVLKHMFILQLTKNIKINVYFDGHCLFVSFIQVF